MAPPNIDENGLLFSIIVTVTSAVVCGVAIILCCWRSKKNQDVESGHVSINHGDTVASDHDATMPLIGKGTDSGAPPSYQSLSHSSQHHYSELGTALTSGTSVSNVLPDSGIQSDWSKHQYMDKKEIKRDEGSPKAVPSLQSPSCSFSSSYLLDPNEAKRNEERKNQMKVEEDERSPKAMSPSQSLSCSPSSSHLLDSNEAKRNEERKKQMKMEEVSVRRLSSGFFEYSSFEPLQSIGSRLQKDWFIVDTGQSGQEILAVVKLSKQCPLDLPKDLSTLQALFHCIKHPYLHKIYNIVCKENYVGILQEFLPEGSVRDFLFQVEPSRDWEEKYEHNATRKFTLKQIAICSRHVLEAVLMLYDLGFPALGQIHIGNVFLMDGRYILGGYENVLLGYRTSLYSQIAKEGFLNFIDVIMFGRMIYEMATGEILSEDDLLLDETYFTKIKDSNLREFLEFIFSEKLRKKRDPMREISDHSFLPDIITTAKMEIELTPDGKKILDRISGKQSSEVEEKLKEDLDIKAVAEKLKGKYSEVKPCKIGWRPQKVWAKAKSKDHGYGLLSAIKIPYTCPIFVEAGLSAMKSILHRKEKFLVCILDLHYLKINEDHILVIFQEMFGQGSFKDEVYETSPWKDWSGKYSSHGHHLHEDQIADIGGQILQISLALCFMDASKSPLKLQFLHTGNIFKREDSIVIGGLENMLIGCRPRDHMKFGDYMECIDTLMFGHLLFELASGRELKTLFPTDTDYQSVSCTKLKITLKTIFDDPTMSFENILDLDFFKPHHTGPLDYKIQNEAEKLLFQHVRKGKRRDQDAKLKKTKYKAKQKVSKFRNILRL